jgi:large subunit ribosomal protein L23
MNLAQILVRPLVTEKTTSQMNSDDELAFEVGIDANKIEIKKAVEAYYGVDVVDVRTSIVRGKTKRRGRYMGRRKNWKKAYVRVAAGQTINIFDV